MLKKLALYALWLVNLLIIFGFWWTGNQSLIGTTTSNIALALGRLAGLLAVYSICLQVMLTGRARWLEPVFGLDKLTRLHALNGYLALFFIVTHPLLIITSYSLISQQSFLAQYFEFASTSRLLIQSSLAVLLFISIIGISLYIVRRRLRYETWYFVHLFVYLAILLAFSHQFIFSGDFLRSPAFKTYWYMLYVFVFGNLLFFRFLRPLYLFARYRFKVSHLIPETHDTTSVYITGKNLATFKTKPGQFVIVRFLDKQRWWEAHPFSLSYLPKNNTLRLTIKNVGDFTSKISQLKPGTPVYVDGPYGSFVVRKTNQLKYLFIAGGVGITPIRSLIEKLACPPEPWRRRGATNNLSLLYANKTDHDIIFKGELEELATRHKFPIHHLIGRLLDAETIKQLVPDFKEHEIYLCGPPPMMAAVKTMLRTLGLPKHQLHYEKFSLHR